MATAPRYYLKGITRVRVADPRAAHKAAEFFELTYRERVALDHENLWPNPRDRAATITARSV